MSRILAAHQPNYLPWMGLFHKLTRADVWVIADDVQFSKHGYTNRVRIRSANECPWLTIPVRSHGKGRQQIRQVEVADTHWQRKHWKTLQWNYRQAPHYGDIAAALEAFYSGSCGPRLLDINVQLLEMICDWLDIDVETRYCSNLPLRQERSERLVDMVLACGCDAYLAGAGASRSYLDEERFRAAGVEVRYVDFEQTEYPQTHPGFEPNMTTLDMLFNCGATRTREALAA